MRWMNASIDVFINRILQKEKPLVIYGAGVTGRVFAEYFVRYWKTDIPISFIDRDPEQIGKQIEIADRKFEIKSPKALERIGKNETGIIAVACTYFQGILDMLEKIDEIKKWECFVLPVIYSTHFTDRTKTAVNSGKWKIPRQIHYCWFGKKEMPQELQILINGWKKICPTYEIIRWNERNYDVKKFIYTKQAFEQKKWAFIADVARLDILYQYGGIYLDTDVELIKNLDPLLEQEAFLAAEPWNVVNPGGGMGCIPREDGIGKLLERWKNAEFVNEQGKINKLSSGYFDTSELIKNGYRLDGAMQCIDGITIYPSEYFHPYNYMTGELNITENTYSIHHFGGGWLREDEKRERENTRSKFLKYLERLEEIQ